ncbi:MAG: sel1 repeat family protein, partial [Bacteroidaceae bacterium]|nr:sel1 repeat family protein [Bacteroidaceae bacterium]
LPQSYEDAARWYRVAAEQGHAEAQCNLGYLHANGLGVEESQEKAFHWYKQAADNGDMTALANLITYYWTGRVVPTSYEKAREIIKTVFEKEPSAMEPISNFFNNCIAEMIQKGMKEETALINQASLGNYVAIEALGILYANQENYSKAYLKFKEGAELGLPHSQYALAMLYLDGLGIKENINNALLWLNKSVSQHYAPAQFQLGGHYLLGDIVKQDRNKGLNLIKLAAENGHEEAISLLESYGL